MVKAKALAQETSKSEKANAAPHTSGTSVRVGARVSFRVRARVRARVGGGVVGSSGGVVGSSGGELGMLNRFSMLNRVNGSHLRNELDGGALGACGDKQASNDSQGANSVAEGLHDLFARGRVLDIFNACSVSHFDMDSCDRGYSSGA